MNKLKGPGKKTQGFGRRKNLSSLASKLNELVVTNYARYHKSVKKACICVHFSAYTEVYVAKILLKLIIQGNYDGFLVWEQGNSVFLVKTMGATPRPVLFVGYVIVDYGSMGNSVKIEMWNCSPTRKVLKITALVGR